MSENPKTIEETIASIKKFSNEDTVVELEGPVERAESLSTGVLGIDWAVGIGGLPKSRLIELYGKESVAKTTVSLTAIATAQKQGVMCAFLDIECAIDLSYARALGVDIKKLLILQPSSAEEALQIIEQMLKDKTVGLIVLDSVAQLATRSEIEGAIGDIKIAPLARLMSSAMRTLIPLLKKSSAVVIFINQIREKSIMFGPGNPEYTMGGRSLKHAYSVRIEMKYKGLIKKGEEVVGTTIKCRVSKNKVGIPMRQVELEIMFGTGVSYEKELLWLGEQFGVCTNTSFGEVKLGRGVDSSASFLAKNEDVALALRLAIQEKMK